MLLLLKVKNNVFPNARNQILHQIAEYRGEVVFYTIQALIIIKLLHFDQIREDSGLRRCWLREI